MKKLALVCACALALSGCCSQKFTIQGTTVPTVPTYQGTSHFIFWGLGQSLTVDPKEICGGKGVKSVETHMTFLDGVASSLTWGIYSPRSYSVYCNR